MFSIINKITFFACALLALTFAINASALPMPNKRATMEKPAALEKRHFNGQATWFSVGLGSCGWESTGDQHVVAINSPQADNQSNCGKSVAILNQQTGTWQYAVVVDECPSCDYGSLDMSPSLFKALNGNDLDQGVFPIGWHFLN